MIERAARIRDRLVKRLHRQRQHVNLMLAWYLGDQTPPGLPRDATGEVYRRIRESSRNTWAALIVDSIAERLEVQGYHSAAGDRELERRAWQLFQENGLDDEQWQVHVDALLAGRGYVSVTPADDGDDVPVVIVPESPLEVVHEWRTGGRRVVNAALKLFEVEPGSGLWRVELTTADYAFAWIGDAGDDATLHPFLGERSPWDAEPLVTANDAGVVPIVPFENRRTTSTGPLSEVAQVQHVLQRIDELLVGRQVASHFAAFRQRWASGLEVPKDPETGKPVEPYKAAVSKVWISEDPESRFGSFEATDLSQYTKAISAEVGELAAISKVPAHYFVQSELANPPSADSLVASEAGLLKKCGARMRSYGESWERVARLALLLDGRSADAIGRSDEVLWADPSVRAPSQVADAAGKLKTIGVPDEALWEFIGASPQQRERWRTMRAEQDLRDAELGLLAQVPVPAVAPPPAP